ncbi:MAG TPA: alpha-amylase family glycosyl hydrolase [Bryobacteraceae bacterium]|nr:alpha-amylase family glycosyl hydrolase [Bryobacteraceae bacterium]
MSQWPRCPTLYEINTWVWLGELRERFGDSTHLGCVPEAEWDSLARFGFDAVWLMGVWERSPAGIAIANGNPGLLRDFRRALPDFRPRDNVGSPYCVRRYVVDRQLGGPEGLAVARAELAKRGMRLILDFVPNHVAPDHPWVLEHPDYFIHGDVEDIARDPASFVEAEGCVFARGRDPNFPAWQDVLQLNAFQPGLREEARKTLSGIAAQCDGVRCDMAMLLMNAVFERTWGNRAGPPPATEYWTDAISSIRGTHPDFLFVAEAYWDLEWALQQQGFDFCYDKRLYDRLRREDAGSVRLHLQAPVSYQEKLVRFIENHDESRAAAAFSPERERAAAVIIATLPGARLFHDGQTEGRKIRLPVFLGRRPAEAADQALEKFYETLLKAIDNSPLRDGQWSLYEFASQPDPGDVLGWTWKHGERQCLVLVNFGGHPAQPCIEAPWSEYSEWHDLFSGESYRRSGTRTGNAPFRVELEPWSYRIFEFS